MDEEKTEEVAKHLKQIATGKGVELEQILLFGSRARNDYKEESDIDLILISEDFQKMDTPTRSKEFYLNWDYKKLPEPEIICFTPEEFKEKKQNRGFIAHTAAEEGIEI